MTCEKSGSDSESTSSRDRLRGSDASLYERLTLCTISELGSQFGELSMTCDRKVFFVAFGVVNRVLSLLAKIGLG
jgi:hypothetical protein